MDINDPRIQMSDDGKIERKVPLRFYINIESLKMKYTGHGSSVSACPLLKKQSPDQSLRQHILSWIFFSLFRRLKKSKLSVTGIRMST